MNKKELTSKIELIKKFLESDRERTDSNTELKELELKLLEKIQEIGEEAFFRNIAPKYKCYCCKEQAHTYINGKYPLPSFMFVCDTCCSFMEKGDKESSDRFWKRLREKGIQTYEVFYPDIDNPYLMFTKREEKD